MVIYFTLASTLLAGGRGGPRGARLDLCGLKVRTYGLRFGRNIASSMTDQKCSDVLFKTGADHSDRLHLGS